MSMTNNTVEKSCSGSVDNVTLLGQSQNSSGIAELNRKRNRVCLTKEPRSHAKCITCDVLDTQSLYSDGWVYVEGVLWG